MSQPHDDLTRITLAVLFIGGLIAASFWVLQPFLPAIVWAMTLVIATWPLMLRVQRHARQPPRPCRPRHDARAAAGADRAVLAGDQHDCRQRRRDRRSGAHGAALRIPPPPDWLADVPLVGTAASQGVGAAHLGRGARAGAAADPLCRRADPVVRLCCRQPGRIVLAVPADRCHRRGDVRRTASGQPRSRCASAAGWAASAARWRCVWPARRSAAWRSAWW